jgi:LAO/AO transport system kinase
MTDMFVLMQLPNAGDDLQAIKKGVMELADLVVINKADIDTSRCDARRSSNYKRLEIAGLAWQPRQRTPQRRTMAPRGIANQCTA